MRPGAVDIPPTPPGYLSITAINHKGIGATSLLAIEEVDERLR